jgi:3D (Asp-Asp-Asp) domain-containing protein
MRLLFLILLIISTISSGETYLGYTGYWVNVVATAYSPHDGIDHHYHETKGERWRWVTADGRTDVRKIPYGIAVPYVNKKPILPFGTKIIIPTGQGYLDISKPNDRIFKVDDVGNGKEYFKSDRGMMHIDLRYKNTDYALKWGKKQIRVFIVTGIDNTNLALNEIRSDLFYSPDIEK